MSLTYAVWSAHNEVIDVISPGPVSQVFRFEWHASMIRTSRSANKELIAGQ
jgi:hypothetical protein